MQVAVAPGTRVAVGHVTVPKPGRASATPTPVRVALPVFAIRNE
jgi:hypothetical protein